MAKYRITSIPQSKPKAQNGGERKRLRNFLFGKEETPAPANIPMIPVPGLNQTEEFDMFQPRTEEQIAATLPTVWTQGTTTPAYDFTYDQQNRMFNPITWRSYENSLEKKLGLPYTGPGGKSEKATVTIPERFTPDYSLGEDGQPLQCPEGKYPYKGKCFSEEMYLKLKQEEAANEQYSFDTKTQERKQQFENEIADIRQKDLEFQQNFQKQRATDYYNKFKNSKKSDKIEPYESVPSYNYDLNAKIPELDAEGNPVLDPKTGEPKFRTQREVLQDSFLVIEDKEAGKVNIYPKDIVYDRIVNNGFQAEQFKNYWGVDPKQVKDQLGDVMTAAKSQYDVTMQQKILQRALDQGKPVSEVVKSLPRSLATKQGAQSFVAPTQKLIDDAIESIKKDLQASAGTDQSKVTQGQDIFFSNNPQAEWEKRNYPNVFDKYYIDKTARGEKAYNEWMDKYGSTGQYDNLTFAKDDRMANQRAINQFNQQALTRNAAESAKQSAESSVFNKALGEYAGNFSIDINKQVITEALDNLDEKGKLKFLKDLQSDPNQAYENLLKTKKDGQSYSDILNDRVESALYFRQNQPVFKQGKANQFNIDESTGAKVKDVLKHPFDALYYLANEREEMWDGPKNLTYSERKKIEEETGMDLGTMPLSVMSPFNYLLQPFNPFKIGFNLREGYDKGEFLPALGKELWDVGSTYGGIKGLNAITRGAKWYKPNVVKPLLQGIDNPLTTGSGLIYANQLFDSAQQSFDQGDYTQAAIDAGLGALSAYPAYRGLQNLNFLRPSASGFSKYTLLESNPLRNQSQPLSLPQPNRLLGFKKGGSLPKAQMGSLVKNVSPVIRNLPGFTERRNIVQGLKQLGYLGPQTMGADMLRAAASNESLKKLMQSAIDYDRTGFRQVSGQFHPVGNRLDNFGNHGQYDMTKPVLGSSLSEYENMLSRGVDINDPFSLGAYQATSIPMDQYGYRAGLPDMSRMDGLYFAATPETQQYGPYQFKVKQDIDLESGNWQDLFDQYILRKNRIYQGGRLRKDLDPSKIYFADPNKGGIQGSGIDMRIWAGGIGNQVGIIDPTFKFTDLKNMSAEDYLDMDTYKKSLINRWNTGFRGDYQSGGMTVELTQDEIDQYVKGGYIIEEQ